MLPIAENIGKILAQKSDMDLVGLSRFAHVGQRRLERIVNQETLPSVAELERIAHALGVSPSVLVESETDPSVDTEVDEQLVELLDNPILAAALWYLGELPEEDRQAIFHVIRRFAATG